MMILSHHVISREQAHRPRNDSWIFNQQSSKQPNF